MDRAKRGPVGFIKPLFHGALMEVNVVKGLLIVLRLLAVVVLVAGLLHLFLGLGADVLLGARASPETIADPTLDSQNRFYGVAFTLYGFLWLICASDLQRYVPILQISLVVLLLAGMARFVSVAKYGMPSGPLVGLLMVELLLPPLLLVWLSRLNMRAARHGASWSE